MKNKFITGLFLSSLQLTSYATLVPSCGNEGFYIGYLNGVGMSRVDATRQLEQFQKQLSFAPTNKQPVTYDLLYNTTQGYASDLAEVFEQRAAESDATGLLQQRYEYISASPTDTDIAPISGLANAIQYIQQGYQALMIKALAALGSVARPIAPEDYVRHNAQLDVAVTNGKKFMLISHSQGSLFLNHAFDYITPKVSAGRIKVNYIAPATPVLHGDYSLTSIDLVINGLGLLQGSKSIPANNTPMPAAMSDVTGHGVLETYLDKARTGEKMVLAKINAALNSFNYPVAAPSAAKTTDYPVAVYTPDNTDPLQGTFSRFYVDTADEQLCWAIQNR